MATFNFLNKWFLTKRYFLLLYSTVLIAIGLAYILVQYYLKSEIQDAVFIGLLFGGSFILIIGAVWIQNYFKSEIQSFRGQFDESVDKHNAKFDFYLESIFSKKNIAIGIFYGLILGLIPVIYDLWPDDVILKVLLGLFLFTVNFLTGIALTTLFRIFQFLYFSSKRIEFNLYDVKHLTEFITTLSKGASIIAALYVSFSITSIYFSILPLDFLTIGYSVFAAFIILSAYIIPIIPISNKTKLIKSEVMKTISSEIQIEFNSLINGISKKNQLDLNHYEKLIEVRKKVSAIQTIPIGLKAVWNSMYIIAITFLPILLQFLLEKLAN